MHNTTNVQVLPQWGSQELDWDIWNIKILDPTLVIDSFQKWKLTHDIPRWFPLKKFVGFIYGAVGNTAEGATGTSHQSAHVNSAKTGAFYRKMAGECTYHRLQHDNDAQPETGGRGWAQRVCKEYQQTNKVIISETVDWFCKFYVPCFLVSKCHNKKTNGILFIHRNAYPADWLRSM